jgi:hypothetical protein
MTVGLKMKAQMFPIRGFPTQRRIDFRFRIDAPVVFSWWNVQGVRLKGEGVTRDIGTKNAYIETVSCPPSDALVEIEIILPFESGVSRELRVKGEAIVIRVVDRSCLTDRANGFAVVRIGSIHWDIQPNPRYCPPLANTHRSIAREN